MNLLLGFFIVFPPEVALIGQTARLAAVLWRSWPGYSPHIQASALHGSPDESQNEPQ